MSAQRLHSIFIVALTTLLCGVPLLYGVYLKLSLSSADREWGREWTLSLFESAEYVVNGVTTEHFELSPYDAMFIDVCRGYGHDWLLFSAIARVESHYRHDAVSAVGACGLMQIMPSTAAIYGVDHTQLHDPRISIEIANRYMIKIERMLMLPDNTPFEDRISLSLAAYNGGIGRIYDAQRLARRAGNDPHKWSELKWHLLSLRKEEVYKRPEVRYGRFRGSGATLAYVRNVMDQYKQYCSEVANSPFHLLPL